MPQRYTTSITTRRAAPGLAMLFACWHCGAATVTVEVVDREGRPVPDVAVYALPGNGSPPTVDAGPHAVMDQVDLEFVPHILIVQSGTVVDFPNSDNVDHHVYSFSPARTFELPLYRGRVYPPLTFDSAGIVTLGCNIHDTMLGYILVVDTPWFAMTDRSGRATLGALPGDRYSVRVWTPRSRSDGGLAEQDLDLGADSDAALSFRFSGKLFPPHRHDGSLTWSGY